MSDQTDLQTALNYKQDLISDLSNIRSGAEAGSTAVQPSSLSTVATSGNYNDLIDKPTFNYPSDIIQDQSSIINTIYGGKSAKFRMIGNGINGNIIGLGLPNLT